MKDEVTRAIDNWFAETLARHDRRQEFLTTEDIAAMMGRGLVHSSRQLADGSYEHIFIPAPTDHVA